LIMNNLSKILDSLNVEYTEDSHKFCLACPIHNSDNPDSVYIYKTKKGKYNKFVCWSHRCAHGYNTVLDLVSFISNKDLYETIEYIEKIANQKVGTVNDTKRDLVNFIRQNSEQQKEKRPVCSSELYYKKMEIPAEYYLKRGFSFDVLYEFGVGICRVPTHEMYLRVIVPIFDENKENVLGYVGRSLYNKCNICGKFHSSNKLCPTNKIENKWSNKWINSYNFSTGNYLYNYWNAKKHCEDSIIIVEGQGDIWRLHEAGIHNAVGIFGCELTENQRNLLDELGVYTLNIALDNDEAGINGKIKIIERYSRYYNINLIEYGEKDIGDMSIESVKQVFGRIK